VDTRPAAIKVDGVESRRSFMTRTAAVFAVGCFGSMSGLREALAMAERKGQPLLTINNLNAYVDTYFNAPLRVTHTRRGIRDERAALAQEAQSDLLGFLQNRFHVTAQQAAYIQSLSAGDLAVINQAIQTALESGSVLQFSEAQSPGGRQIGGAKVDDPLDPKAGDKPTAQTSSGTAGIEMSYNQQTGTTTVKIWWPC
jgi:hypothetical protein